MINLFDYSFLNIHSLRIASKLMFRNTLLGEKAVFGMVIDLFVRLGPFYFRVFFSSSKYWNIGIYFYFFIGLLIILLIFRDYIFNFIKE